MKKRVIRQIEELLYKNEFVVVPGLGAFLRHSSPAEVDEVKGLIYPPKNSLSFNGSLSQSDGMLLQSYVLRYSISTKKAESLIREDVKDLVGTLRTTGLLQMGSLGRLWMTGEGKIEFAPEANHPFTTYFFGYTPVVTLSPSDAHSLVKKEVPETREKNVVYLPVNLSFLKYGAAATLFVLALLLFPKSLTDKPLSPSEAPQYQAGFFSGTPKTKKVEAPFEAVPGTPMEATEKEAPKETSGRMLFGLPLLTPDKDGAAPRYYVVIATLRSESAVKQYLEEKHPSDLLPEIGIIHTNRSSSDGGTYRVYTSVSDTPEEARQLMQKLHRENEVFSDAWVYQYPLS